MVFQKENNPTLAPWGKFNRDARAFHHLTHHRADVAAVFRALLDYPLFERAACRAAGAPLEPLTKTRMTALAFLHDIGKLAPGFQAKGWPPEMPKKPVCNHNDAAFQWLGLAGDCVKQALHSLLPDMLQWCNGDIHTVRRLCRSFAKRYNSGAGHI